VLPDASIVLHYMLVRFTGLVEGLVVDQERMTANLETTHGLVFSQGVLLALVETGLSRDDAYRIVQRHAMSVWDGKGDLRDLISNDPESGLTGDQLDECFSPESIKSSVGVVFDRLAEVELP
jgi:adenylosuccinate lyase